MAPPHTLPSQYENGAMKEALPRQEDAVTFVQTAVPNWKGTVLVTGLPFGCADASRRYRTADTAILHSTFGYVQDDKSFLAVTFGITTSPY
jgi:hypothetical protein